MRKRGGSLKLVNVTAANAGLYRCTVDTPYHEAASRDTHLVVKGEVPSVVVVSSSSGGHQGGQQVSVMEGTDQMLNCIARGLPTPTVRWTLDGAPFKGQVNQLASERDRIESQVPLLKISRRQSGNYSCQVRENHRRVCLKFPQKISSASHPPT